MKKKGRGEHEARVSRRRFIRSGAYTAAGAVAGAGTGYVINKVLGLMHDGIGYVGQRLSNLDERVDKMEGTLGKGAKTVKNVETGRANIWRRIFGIGEDDTKANRERYGVETEKDREEFASGRERKKYDKPGVSVAKFGIGGAGAGLAYGTYKHLKDPLRKQTMEMARLKDQVELLEKNAGKYESEVEKLKKNPSDIQYLKQVEGQLGALRNQVGSLHRQYDKQIINYHHLLESGERKSTKDVKGQTYFHFMEKEHGGLETKARHHVAEMALLTGVIFMVLAIFTFSFRNLLGFVISESVKAVNAVSALCYILSLISFFLWFALKD